MYTYTILIFVLAVFCTKGVFSDDIKHEPVHHELKLGNKLYSIYTEKTQNFLEAYRYCKSTGKELLSIDSLEENEDLYNTLINMFQSSSYMFWTSAFRTSPTSTDWTWLNSGEPIREFFWINGQPAHTSGDLGITLYFGPYSPRAWWQASAISSSYYTICQSI